MVFFSNTTCICNRSTIFSVWKYFMIYRLVVQVLFSLDLIFTVHCSVLSFSVFVCFYMTTNKFLGSYNGMMSLISEDPFGFWTITLVLVTQMKEVRIDFRDNGFNCSGIRGPKQAFFYFQDNYLFISISIALKLYQK